MATDQGSDASASRNPGITEIEPHNVQVQPDHDVGGVTLEVADQAGNGFRTILDQLAALEVALRIIGAVARLRGWSTT